MLVVNLFNVDILLTVYYQFIVIDLLLSIYWFWIITIVDLFLIYLFVIIFVELEFFCSICQDVYIRRKLPLFYFFFSIIVICLLSNLLTSKYA